VTGRPRGVAPPWIEGRPGREKLRSAHKFSQDPKRGFFWGSKRERHTGRTGGGKRGKRGIGGLALQGKGAAIIGVHNMLLGSLEKTKPGRRIE